MSLLLLLNPTPATYYVKTGGSDAADGLSDGTAWQTLAKVNGFPFAAGDIVQFNRGDIWRETLSQKDGVTFRAYGTGNKPSIRGSNTANSTGDWTEDSSAVDLNDLESPAGGDDGYFGQSGTGFNSSFGNMRVGDEDGIDQTVFARFVLNVPQGATITAATLDMVAGGTQSGSISVEVQAVDADNAAAPTTAAEGQALPLTTASVTWTVPNTTSGNNYATPDFSSVVQEVVDRGSWASGNYITIILRTTSAAAWTIRDFRSKEHGTAGERADLNVSYAAGTPGLWYLSSITVDPQVFVHDGVLGRRETSSSGLGTDWDYWWDDTNDRFYVYHGTGNPADQATLLEYGVRNQILGAFSGVSSSYENLDVRHNRGDQVNGTFSTHTLNFTGCDFTQIGQGVIQYNNGGTGMVDGCTFTDWAIASGASDYAVQVIGFSGTPSGPVDVTDSTYTLTMNNARSGGDCMAVISDDDGWIREVTGCTVDLVGKGDEGILVYRPPSTATTITITDNTVSNTGAMGVAVVGLEVNGGTPTVVVARNVILGACAIDEADTEGLRIADFTTASDVTVHHNTVTTVDGANTHSGIRVNAATGVKVYHNTVYDCDDGIRVCNDWAIRASTANVRNNIVTACRGTEGVLTGSSTFIVEDYNDWHGTVSGFTIGAHSITGDPLLTDPANDIFTLAGGSPAVDVGVVIGGINDGYVGAAPDLGAYESTSASYNEPAATTILSTASAADLRGMTEPASTTVASTTTSVDGIAVVEPATTNITSSASATDQLFRNDPAATTVTSTTTTTDVATFTSAAATTVTSTTAATDSTAPLDVAATNITSTSATSDVAVYADPAATTVTSTTASVDSKPYADPAATTVTSTASSTDQKTGTDPAATAILSQTSAVDGGVLAELLPTVVVSATTSSDEFTPFITIIYDMSAGGATVTVDSGSTTTTVESGGGVLIG